MRKLLYIFLFLALACSKDNDEECEALYDQYIEALGFAGNSQTAMDEITRQYNQRRADLGCD